jgi:hypothetical protein
MFRQLAPLVTAAVVLLAACGDTAAPIPADVVGRYVLTTVSGRQVPAAGVLDGVILLFPNGTAKLRIAYGSISAPGAVDAWDGNFVVRGDEVLLTGTLTSMTPSPPVQWRAHLEGRSMTMRLHPPNDGPDIVHVYRREE